MIQTNSEATMAADTAEGRKDAIRVDTRGTSMRRYVRAWRRHSTRLLQAEADQICGAVRYERSPERVDTRAGSYECKLETKAGEVTLRAEAGKHTVRDGNHRAVIGGENPRSRKRWWRCTWREWVCDGWKTSPRRCGECGSVRGR